MRRISELEKEVHEIENSRLQSSANGTSPLLGLPPSASVQQEQPSTQESDPLEECERLRGLVKKLKGDRSALQDHLASKYSEVKQLQQAKTELERELQKWQKMEKEKCEKEEALREEIQSLTQKVRELEAELYEDKKQTVDDIMEMPNKKEEMALDQGPNISDGSSSLSLFSDFKEEDEIVTFIQSVFRAHLARKECPEERTFASSASSERTCTAVSYRKKKPISPALKKRLLSAFTSTSPDGENSELTSEEVVEELSAEGEERKSREHKLLSLQSSSVMSSQNQLQSTLSPPLDEAHSDDSDDSVVSPSLMVKKNFSHF